MMFFKPTTQNKLPPAVKHEIERKVQIYANQIASANPGNIVGWVDQIYINSYKERLKNEALQELEENLVAATHYLAR